MVKWPIIFFKEGKEGLGFRCLLALSKALLSKWMQRFVVEWDCSCRHIIKGKFAKDEGVWFSREGKEKLVWDRCKFYNKVYNKGWDAL